MCYAREFDSSHEFVFVDLANNYALPLFRLNIWWQL